MRSFVLSLSITLSCLWWIGCGDETNIGNGVDRPDSPPPIGDVPRLIPYHNPLPSAVIRSGRMHFIMDASKRTERGVFGFVNGVNLCFIASTLQLLLHTAPFRDLLHTIANEPHPQVSPLLEDFVYLFNKVWGDGWPLDLPQGKYPAIRIHDRLYATLIRADSRFGIRHGEMGQDQAFFRNLFGQLKREIDSFRPNTINNLFASKVEQYLGNHIRRMADFVTFDIRPLGADDQYRDLEVLLRERLGGHRHSLQSGHAHCPVCREHAEISSGLIGPWTTLPAVLVFETFNPTQGPTPRPPTVLSFFDGEVLDRDDPKIATETANNNPLLVQYDLVGYNVGGHNHFFAIVKHPETNIWYEMNDSIVTPISDPDPRTRLANGKKITLIVYAKRRG
jgi:hypothetical protein